MRASAGVLGVAVLTGLLTGCTSGGDAAAKLTPSSRTTSVSTTSTSASSETSSSPTKPAASSSGDAVDPSALVTGSTQPLPSASQAPTSAAAASTTPAPPAAVPQTVSFSIAARPFGPQPVQPDQLDRKVTTALPAAGIISDVRAGSRLAPASASTKLAAVWMDGSSVLKVDTIAPCSSGCAAVSAPAGSTKVMVIGQDKVAGIDADAPVSAG